MRRLRGIAGLAILALACGALIWVWPRAVPEVSDRALSALPAEGPLKIVAFGTSLMTDWNHRPRSQNATKTKRRNQHRRSSVLLIAEQYRSPAFEKAGLLSY